MAEFRRSDLLFSLCGLNCGLCPMQIGGYCPGCGGGPGNRPCAAARCSQQHDVAYCGQCREFPCSRFQRPDLYDSFISYRRRMSDIARVRQIGLKAYHEQLQEKIRILRFLLEHFNDGRKKSLFCTAVNLLELEDLRPLLEPLEDARSSLPLKEGAARAETLLRQAAARRGVDLTLRKKPPNRRGTRR